MIDAQRTRVLQQAISLHQAGLMSRRQLVKMMGALGLGAIATSALGRMARAQEGSPVPMATPQIGPRADGSTLWRVQVAAMDMENGIELHGFFPGEITVNAGDSIWFAGEMPGFHTVTFPGDGGDPPLLIPDPEEPAPATPVPGPPKLIFNPILLTGTGGTAVDGSQLVSSAADIFADPTNPQPWVFSFPTPGSYEYICIIHSLVMRGTVVVQEAGGAAPMDQAAIDAAAAEEIAALMTQAQAEVEKYSQATSTDKADGGKVWEVAVGAGGATPVRIMRFLPDTLEISAGDSIKFINQSEGEPHTVTLIGEGETPPEDAIVESFADGSPKFVQNMLTFLPQGGTTWSGSGYLNSGFTGLPQLGLPMEYEILFDTAGEFIPYCILHGGPDGSRMAMKLSVKAAG